MENKDNTIEKLKALVTQYENELASKEADMQNIRSDFMANFTHEIRTPMNVIVGFANLLNDPAYNSNQKNFFVEEINKNSKHLLQLIDRVLYVSKIESENISIQKEELNAADLTTQLIKEIKSAFSSRKYKNKIDIVSFVSKQVQKSTIVTDFEKLKSALVILLEDLLRESDNHVSIAINFNQDEITFTFKAKTRGSYKSTINSFNENYNNYGIDLVMADRLIKLLGGALKVRSNLKNESSLYFTIPLLVEKPVQPTG